MAAWVDLNPFFGFLNVSLLRVDTVGTRPGRRSVSKIRGHLATLLSPEGGERAACVFIPAQFSHVQPTAGRRDSTHLNR